MRRTLAAAIALLLASVAVWVGMPAATAAESITSYAVKAQVTPDGLLKITEYIDYDFDYEFRHGIFRTLPTQDELPDGTRWVHPVTIESVSMDGGPVPYEISESGMLMEVKVGDPDVTITGDHTYVISYVVEGALRTLTEADFAPGNPYGFTPGDVELYWDFIGGDWPVNMDDVRVQVTGPGDVLAAQCYVGFYGSTYTCNDRIAGAQATFVPGSLYAYEGMTAVIAYPGSAFTAPPTRVITSPPLSESPGRVFPYGLGAGIALLVLPPLLVIIFRRQLRGADIPNAPVRFGPPDNLRPAEIAVGLDGQLPARAVLATLLDLVARRYITLSSDDGGIFKPDRIDLAWWGAGTDGLRPWEEKMTGAIFEGRERASLQGYDADFAKAVSGVQADLRREAILAERFDAEARSTRTRVGCASSIAMALTIAAFFAGMWSENMLVFAGLLPALIGLTAGLVIARFFVPDRETVATAKFEAEVEGFKKFLDTDPGAARRDLVQRLGLPDYAVYATMLPYAVLFDLEDSWSGAFPDLTEEQLHMSGLYLTNTMMIHNLMSSGTSTVSTAFTAPRASGGSGFSGGGGGFSGGGGGGGGGGSW